MKQNVSELSDAGKRKLLAELCDELSAAEINKLVAKYADRLELDNDGEPYIVIRQNEAEIRTNDYKYWLDINDVETFVIESEDYIDA